MVGNKTLQVGQRRMLPMVVVNKWSVHHMIKAGIKPLFYIFLKAKPSWYGLIKGQKETWKKASLAIKCPVRLSTWMGWKTWRPDRSYGVYLSNNISWVVFTHVLTRCNLYNWISQSSFPHRIPKWLASNSHSHQWSMKLQLATMDFLNLGMSISKVLTWSSQAQSTEVESEFIIMEKADGDSANLSARVDHVNLVHKVAKLHRPLLDLRFTQYGSFYYKSNVDVSHRSTVGFLDLESTAVPVWILTSVHSAWDPFLGDFWEDERASIELNRGSCASASPHTLICCRTWNQGLLLLNTWSMLLYASRPGSIATKSPIFTIDFRGLPLQGKQDDHIGLLEYYKYLLHLVPNDDRYLMATYGTRTYRTGDLLVVPSDSKTWDGKINIMYWLARSMSFTGFSAAHCSNNVPRSGVRSEALDADVRKEAERIHSEAVLRELFETIVLTAGRRSPFATRNSRHGVCWIRADFISALLNIRGLIYQDSNIC